MNPRSSSFARIMSNPFAYTAFKSTEPWLQVGYVTVQEMVIIVQYLNGNYGAIYIMVIIVQYHILCGKVQYCY